ncbi:MAG: SDR family oxidoreductase [Spirochaetes bacterium]|nr:SDR family oxidoreductase [Spirochaetota bacterium]
MSNIIITGAAGGIGVAFCDVFHNAGYKVIAIDRRPIDYAHPYKFINFDISKLGTTSNEVKEFYEKIKSHIDDGLTGLINNAAIQIVKDIEDVNQDDWLSTLNSNLLAPYWLIQQFLPQLRRAKGSVINIASIHANLTKAKFCLYATSKGAMVTMTRALALELAPEIRVNAIVPAATDTPMLRAGFKGDLDGLAELGRYHPLHRIADAEEVAKVGLYLVSNNSSFITGTTINVDGGIGSVLHDPATNR